VDFSRELDKVSVCYMMAIECSITVGMVLYPLGRSLEDRVYWSLDMGFKAIEVCGSLVREYRS
jgi:hypothetical protein